MKGNLVIRPSTFERFAQDTVKAIYVEVKVGNDIRKTRAGYQRTMNRFEWHDEVFNFPFEGDQFLFIRVNQEGIFFEDVLGESGWMLTSEFLSEKRRKGFEFVKDYVRTGSLVVDIEFYPGQYLPHTMVQSDGRIPLQVNSPNKGATTSSMQQFPSPNMAPVGSPTMQPVSSPHLQSMMYSGAQSPQLKRQYSHGTTPYQKPMSNTMSPGKSGQYNNFNNINNN